jgi:hypothetical protein
MCRNLTFGSVRMTITLPKWGLGSLLGLLKLQSSITGDKTPCIGVFFILLESYRSLDVKNGLAWAIWTFANFRQATPNKHYYVETN